jgi:hypothetical protein
MKGTIRLDNREIFKKKAGFPVVVFLYHNNKQKRITLPYCFALKDWDLNLQLPKKDAKKRLEIQKLKLKLESLILDAAMYPVSLDTLKNSLFGKVENFNDASFYAFYDEFLNELQQKEKFASFNIYTTAKDRLKEYRSDLIFADLDYNLFNGFKNWRLKKGNSKNTIHTYLRKFRAVYNEAVKRGFADDKKPFADVFKGITVKSNRTKKKNITKLDIVNLETAENLTFAEQRTVDLFLLLFYFGGQDLKDVYYLEHKNINNNRVYFTRGKLDGGGYQFDLKIVPKAQNIIDRHQVKGKYLFGWRKDFEGYKTFRDNFRRSLLKVQKKLKIKVRPLDGNIGIKVARHTFATFGKNLFIDADCLRELMGHERDDVDTIYKDRYPEAIRDEAHLKIIDSPIVGVVGDGEFRNKN